MIVENMNNENFLGKPRYNFSKRTFPNETNLNLTNDSGVGNAHIEPTTGDYEVEKLNELIIRLIKKYTKTEV